MKSFVQEFRCDGCGITANAEHLRERVARLELATRFRPVHIQTLFLYPAPPKRMADYFYQLRRTGEERSLASQAFFEALLACAGCDLGAAKAEEVLLADFQRLGCFVAECSECPVEGAATFLSNRAEQLATTVLHRVQFSYKPKLIVLLSGELDILVPLFRNAGFGERLVLRGGQAIRIPSWEDPAESQRFRATLSEAFREMALGAEAKA